MKAFELQTPAGVTLATLTTPGAHSFGEVVLDTPPYPFVLKNTGDEAVTNVKAWIELISPGGRRPRIILGGVLITGTNPATAQLVSAALAAGASMAGTAEYQAPLTAQDSGRLRLQGT